ncbi:hypothetical protein DVH24_036369 [Malus domestica]|uniref:Uncharacterized protein n=1 Tax=Malus domestica TaxID=3750 RepID=A0A498IEL7_MALDO|nr:hypothetical protein DVH24_036369 [Malus domestica]
MKPGKNIEPIASGSSLGLWFTVEPLPKGRRVKTRRRRTKKPSVIKKANRGTRHGCMPCFCQKISGDASSGFGVPCFCQKISGDASSGFGA